jgi:hypothetical protein
VLAHRCLPVTPRVRRDGKPIGRSSRCRFDNVMRLRAPLAPRSGTAQLAGGGTLGPARPRAAHAVSTGSAATDSAERAPLNHAHDALGATLARAVKARAAHAVSTGSAATPAVRSGVARVQRAATSGTIVVAGAAVLCDRRILVAKRLASDYEPGRWMLPSWEVGEDSVVGAVDALEKGFTEEFSTLAHCLFRISVPRDLHDYRSEADFDFDVSQDAETDAQLDVWRCQLEFVGDEAPMLFANRHSYDEVRWVDVDDLDAVGPWRAADRMAADEIAGFAAS